MKGKKTICVVTQSHLCRNPRVLKEAILLATNGYKVKVITSIISPVLYQQDLEAIKAYPAIRFQIISDLSKSTFTSFLDRLLTKTGRLLKKLLQIETSLSLGYGSYKYHKACRTVNASLYICHQELGTYAGIRLVRAGYQVAFDFEDWYSEDLLPQAQKQRPVKLLRKTEAFALNKGVFCLTTSNALAKKLSEVYLCNAPAVIYNVFNTRRDLLGKQKNLSETPKLFWFSQTIGPGRGLEQFIDLLGLLKTKVELHLMGNIGAAYHDQLKTLMPAQHKLFFHDLVEEHHLADKIAGFDIGLALELETPPSRNYTITNKFFQYLQAGLPIIVSETAGQKEAFEKFKPGFEIPQHPADANIAALDKWLGDPSAIMEARHRAVEAAEYYNWESESAKLLTHVNHSLE